MNLSALRHIRKAVQKRSDHVREMSEKPLNIGLYAASEDDYRKIEGYLLEGLSPARRVPAAQVFACEAPDPQRVLQFEPGCLRRECPCTATRPGFSQRRTRAPGRINRAAILMMRLRFRWHDISAAFRTPYVEHAIRTVSRENALFSMATALPDIVPNLIELPWAATSSPSIRRSLPQTR